MASVVLRELAIHGPDPTIPMAGVWGLIVGLAVFGRGRVALGRARGATISRSVFVANDCRHPSGIVCRSPRDLSCRFAVEDHAAHDTWLFDAHRLRHSLRSLENPIAVELGFFRERNREITRRGLDRVDTQSHGELVELTEVSIAARMNMLRFRDETNILIGIDVVFDEDLFKCF